DRRLRQAHELYVAVSARDRAAPPLLLFLVMARLERRVQILRLLKWVAGPGKDVLASQTDVGAIGDALLDEAEAAVAAMAAPLHRPAVSGEATVEAVRAFADICRGMTRDLRVRRD